MPGGSICKKIPHLHGLRRQNATSGRSKSKRRTLPRIQSTDPALTTSSARKLPRELSLVTRYSDEHRSTPATLFLLLSHRCLYAVGRGVGVRYLERIFQTVERCKRIIVTPIGLSRSAAS